MCYVQRIYAFANNLNNKSWNSCKYFSNKSKNFNKNPPAEWKGQMVGESKEFVYLDFPYFQP